MDMLSTVATTCEKPAFHCLSRFRLGLSAVGKESDQQAGHIINSEMRHTIFRCKWKFRGSVRSVDLTRRCERCGCTHGAQLPPLQVKVMSDSGPVAQ